MTYWECSAQNIFRDSEGVYFWLSVRNTVEAGVRNPLSEIWWPLKVVCGTHTEFGYSVVWDFDLPHLHQQLSLLFYMFSSNSGLYYDGVFSSWLVLYLASSCNVHYLSGRSWSESDHVRSVYLCCACATLVRFFCARTLSSIDGNYRVINVISSG